MNSILWLSWRNAKRWRWRLLSIAVLVALAFVLHVLYAASLESSSQDTQQQSTPLRIEYFDIMIVPEAGQPVLALNQLPARPFTSASSRNLPQLKAADLAAAVTVSSSRGDIELLGLREGSPFFVIPAEKLQGRREAGDGEMVLPQGIAARFNLEIGDILRVSAWQGHARQSGLLYSTMTLVGIYEDDFDMAPGLIRLDQALDLLGAGEPNRFLVQYDRINDNINSVTTWLRIAYPRAQFITSQLPQDMSSGLLQQILQPGQSVLMMIVLFVTIGVLTIAIMTFLERRKEIAAFKTIGVGNTQIVMMHVLEYGLAEICGLLIGGFILAGLALVLTWLREISALALLRMVLIAALNTILAVVVALVFPVLTARVASVNQLIYARRIPLRTRRIDHIEEPKSEMVYREHTENVRLVKVPPPSETMDLIFFKQVGDPVKRGEVIVTRESWFGFYIEEWLAPCDGQVNALEPNGIVSIMPEDPKAPFYPYPDHLYELEKRHRETMRQAVEEYRALPQDISEEAKGLLLSDRRRVKADGPITFLAGESGAKKPLTARQQTRRFRLGVATLMALSLVTYTVLEVWLRDVHLQEELGDYTAMLVVPVTLQDVVKAAGNLVPTQTGEVRAEVAGWITEVLVSPSEMVSQDQPLYMLSNPTLLIALDQATQDLATAQLQYDQLRVFAEAGRDGVTWSEAQLKVLQLQNHAKELQQNQERLRVVAKNSGVITAVYVAEGGMLARDTALFGLYDASLESDTAYQARLLQAKALLDSRWRELEKLSLRAEHAGTVGEIYTREGRTVTTGDLMLRVDGVEQTASRSEAEILQIATAKGVLAQREQAVQDLRLTAPVAGLLANFNLKIGDTVAAQQQWATLGENLRMQVVVQVPQSKINGVSRGDGAEITFYPSGFTRSGVVEEIAVSGVTQASTQAVHYAVTIGVENRNDLSPGMSVSVALLSSDPTTGNAGRIEGLRGSLQNTNNRSLRATVAGEVVSVEVENGTQVRQDQVLAVLSNSTLELARDQAKRDLEHLLGSEVRAAIAATVAQILVVPGEEVQQGQVLIRLNQGATEVAYAQALRDYENLLNLKVANTTIRAEAAGTLAALYVREGDTVEPGQVLAELQDSDAVYQAQRAAADALKAEAELRAAQMNPGAGSLAQAELKLEQARRIWEARQREADALILRAPCDGMVRLIRQFQAGEVLDANTLVATVADIRWLELRVTVDELDILRLREGMTVEVEINAFEDEIFSGEVAEIAGAGIVTESGAVFPVTFRLNPEPRLRAGMTSTAYVIMNEVPNVFAVPREAVRRIDYGDRVVELVDRLVGDMLAETEVTTGMWTRTHVEITRGLREGDVVVIYRNAVN